jgi:hypothetical protein
VQTYSLSMSGFWGHGSPLAASAGIDLDPGYIWASLELRIIGTGLVLMTTGIGQVPESLRTCLDSMFADTE